MRARVSPGGIKTKLKVLFLENFRFNRNCSPTLFVIFFSILLIYFQGVSKKRTKKSNLCNTLVLILVERNNYSFCFVDIMW